MDRFDQAIGGCRQNRKNVVGSLDLVAACSAHSLPRSPDACESKERHCLIKRKPAGAFSTRQGIRCIAIFTKPRHWHQTPLACLQPVLPEGAVEIAHIGHEI